ncbi:DUF551 domain-containing protein [Klebsiella pneumoniae]|uniref:DUF551 domain-containing protein n=1 Tax=Klebsiella pneumoniae TaxID=573 RepID=A0A939NS23_KLEPN|nr:DUF551 domain-containing protein [Klebsiella pneumoniae]
MDSEPVAYIFKHPAGRLFWSLTDESNKGHDDVMPVYDSPQSPGSEPATVPGKWIPVSERMPEVGVKVLCFPVKDEPIHATFNGQLWLQDISWSGSDEPIDNVIPTSVTHWMPLPAARRRLVMPKSPQNAKPSVEIKPLSGEVFLVYAHFAFIPGKGDNYLVSLDN